MSPNPLEPPRLARLVAGLLSPSADRSFVLADLDERFEAISATSGYRRARRWYWSQALRGGLALLTPDLELAKRRSWTGTAGDVRQGVRTLRRRPLYTLGVVGTLLGGLASAAVVLSVAWHVWLAPMPFPDPDRVVRLFELEPPPGEADVAWSERTRWRLSPPLLEDLRRHRWETVTAVSGVSPDIADWLRDDATIRLSSLMISPELFTILGLSPVAGRGLSDDADAAEVVLSLDFWSRAFGSDPAVVGSTMTLSGVPHVVVGVVELPHGYPGSADILRRLAFGQDQLAEGMRGARYLDVVARVGGGLTVAEASAEMDRVVTELGRAYGNHAGWRGEAVSLSEELLRPYRSVLALLLAAGAAFLLLAVVNVAGLVAAKSVDGRRERSVRLALGASEPRLLRASLIESGLVGVLAAAGAVMVSTGLVGPIRSMIPADVPRVENITLSPGIVGVVVAVALASGCAVGLLGYLLSRGAEASVGRGARDVSERSRLRSAIVAGQVALTTLLALAGAGVLRHALILQRIDLGFEPAGVAMVEMALNGDRYDSTESRLDVWRSLVDGLEGRGLRAAIGTGPPMSGVNMPWGYRRDAASDQAFAQYHIVTPDYFDVLSVGVVDGRIFTADDREGAAPVVVVNDVLASETFPDGAVGRDLSVIGQRKTIVGVVRATRHFGPSEAPPAEIYVPFGQDPWPYGHVLVRGDPAEVAPLVASASDEVDPLLALEPVAPYERFVAEWYATLRLQLIIVGVLALVGITLATLGVYALIAYRVGTRRREIGVRMALGASDVRMFSEVVRQGVSLAVLGLSLGFAVWYVTVPAMDGVLGDVDFLDPWVAAAVAFLVGAASAVASALPARSSVTVDPAVVLRSE